ncbi:hypothetical protein BJ165DRAFT_1528334 [Panaeolus papilionaceus]|nr:hypothetical protein BJ165DRAFT_1528334 [Panaeolus papilionaceus]
MPKPWAPDATWFLSGLTSKVSMAGTASYLSRFDSFAEFRKQFSTFDVSIRDVVAEGNKVVLEVETNGTSAAHDRVYKNTGIVKLEVEDGKIKEVREYLDFFVLFEFLGVPPT